MSACRIGKGIRLQRYALRLQKGAVFAHETATLAGLLAHPDCPTAIRRLQVCKQRQGPFLLLAASKHDLFRCLRYCTRFMRLRLTAESESITWVVPARPGFQQSLYQQACLAIRVDKHVQAQALSRASGGLLLSTSLNRKGQKTLRPHRALSMRWHRHIDACILGEAGTSKASRMIRLQAFRQQVLR